MLSLESVTSDTFSPHVGQPFHLALNTDIAFTLVNIKVLPRTHGIGTRDAFVLEFRGAGGLRLPQQIHALRHETLGEVELFLVQHGDGPQGSEFSATFS